MKPIELFEDDDFKEMNISNAVFFNPYDYYTYLTTFANAKLNSWLKDAVRVYASSQFDPNRWNAKVSASQIDTHQALLVCIEKIEKKECEHDDVVVGNTVEGFECAKCGAEIKPSGWKAVE